MTFPTDSPEIPFPPPVAIAPHGNIEKEPVLEAYFVHCWACGKRTTSVFITEHYMALNCLESAPLWYHAPEDRVEFRRMYEDRDYKHSGDSE